MDRTGQPLFVLRFPESDAVRDEGAVRPAPEAHRSGDGDVLLTLSRPGSGFFFSLEDRRDWQVACQKGLVLMKGAINFAGPGRFG